jgi:hypothetical protein
VSQSTGQVEFWTAGEAHDVGWAQEPQETELAKAIPEAVLHLRTALAAGAPWPRALLEAMGLWTLPEESYEGRRYKYLVHGEAFDWLLLAERLCADVDGLIPSEEKEKLLFSGRMPEPIEDDEFRDLLGVSKYRAYLNFHYGVVLEEALQLAVEEEIRKRLMARCYTDNDDLVEEAFRLLYHKSRSELLEEFRIETKMDRRRGMSLLDLKEFTYWLHKLRINLWDPARVASDTRKAIKRLGALEEITLGGVAGRN